MFRRLLFCASLLLSLVPPPARAGIGLAEDDGLCAAAVSAAGVRWGIPPGLLKAIAKVESNLWPWTIDAAGEPQSFADRAEAERRASTLRESGLRNIDVGCMQINLQQHPEAFSSLSQAFDPEANADFAGRFLAALKRLSGSWDLAVAHYHSATPALGQAYLQKVLAAWRDEEPARQLLRGFLVEIQSGVRILRPAGYSPPSDSHMILVGAGKRSTGSSPAAGGERIVRIVPTDRPAGHSSASAPRLIRLKPAGTERQ